MRSKLARSENSIVLPSLDLVDQVSQSFTDLFHQPGSGYELDENEVVVDLFCGAGGTSEGVRLALGESPAFAVNHNPDAIGVHDINHPETIHLLSDVFAANPEEHIAADKKIGLLCASPSCVHFSTARGGKPLDREIRDQAWVVANWCEHPNPRFNPRVVVVENVREFLTWAPLTSENKIDKRFIDKQGLGSTFKEWRSRLVAAGYEVQFRILNAADYGAATKRKRLLIVARKDGLPIRFPNPTHGPRNSPEVKKGILKPYRPASDCIDFAIKASPIFMYPADAKAAGVNRPLADNTLRRVAAGVERYVIEADDPFIVSYYGPKNGEFRGQSVHDPLSTQTTENRFAIVNPMVSPITHTGPGRYYMANDQLPTLTCAKRGELALISTVCSAPEMSGSALIPMRRDTNAVEMKDLVPALTTNSQIALALGGLSPVGINKNDGHVTISIDEESVLEAPFLTATGGSEYAAKPRRIDQPINTLKCDNRSALIVPTLIRIAHGSVDRNGKRRGRADHDITEPLPTQSTSNEFAVVTPAFVVTTGYGEREGQAPRVLDIQDPLTTFVAGGTKHAIVAANLIRTDMHKSNATCAYDISDPTNAFTTGGGFALVESGLKSSADKVRAPLIVNNNTNRLATSVEDPVPAMTTGNQQIVTEVGMSAVHLGQENFTDPGRSAKEPFSTMTVNPHQSVIETGLAPAPDHLVAAHMAQQNEGNVGHPVTEPISTMTTKVCHQNLVTSHLLTLRQNGIGQSLDEPISAFCAAGNHHGEVRACFVKYYGEGSQHQAMDVPLDTLTAKPRFAVVSVPVEELGLTEEQRFEAWWIARFLEMYGTKDQGNPNTAHLDGPRPSIVGRPGAVLWTIQMRMLVPKEAFAASSFPDHYEFEKTSDGRKVSKTASMALVGNAVPPLLAKAIIGANVKPRPSVAARLSEQLRKAA